MLRFLTELSFAELCLRPCLSVYVKQTKKKTRDQISNSSPWFYEKTLLFSLIHCYVSLDVGWPGNLLLAVLNGMDYFCVGTVHILRSYFV